MSPYDLQTRRPQMPALIIPIRMPTEADLLKPCRKMIFFFSPVHLQRTVALGMAF